MQQSTSNTTHRRNRADGGEKHRECGKIQGVHKSQEREKTKACEFKRSSCGHQSIKVTSLRSFLVVLAQLVSPICAKPPISNLWIMRLFSDLQGKKYWSFLDEFSPSSLDSSPLNVAVLRSIVQYGNAEPQSGSHDIRRKHSLIAPAHIY